MPVVVNEFEVVAQAAPPTEETPAPAASRPSPSAAGEAERALRLLYERSLRRRAD